jgi:hypothetical protein
MSENINQSSSVNNPAGVEQKIESALNPLTAEFFENLKKLSYAYLSCFKLFIW